MHLFLLGVSHRTAPVELREQLDFATRGVGTALSALAARPAASEAVVLSTCNRAEIYVACDDVAAARTDLVAFLASITAWPRADLAPHVYERTDARRRAAPVPRGGAASTRWWSASRRSSAR